MDPNSALSDKELEILAQIVDSDNEDTNTQMPSTKKTKTEQQQNELITSHTTTAESNSSTKIPTTVNKSSSSNSESNTWISVKDETNPHLINLMTILEQIQINMNSGNFNIIQQLINNNFTENMIYQCPYPLPTITGRKAYFMYLQALHRTIPDLLILHGPAMRNGNNIKLKVIATGTIISVLQNTLKIDSIGIDQAQNKRPFDPFNGMCKCISAYVMY